MIYWNGEGCTEQDGGSLLYDLDNDTVSYTGGRYAVTNVAVADSRERLDDETHTWAGTELQLTTETTGPQSMRFDFTRGVQRTEVDCIVDDTDTIVCTGTSTPAS
jgi:hypothetical protein